MGVGVKGVSGGARGVRGWEQCNALLWGARGVRGWGHSQNKLGGPSIGLEGSCVSRVCVAIYHRENTHISCLAGGKNVCHHATFCAAMPMSAPP